MHGSSTLCTSQPTAAWGYVNIPSASVRNREVFAKDRMSLAVLGFVFGLIAGCGEQPPPAGKSTANVGGEMRTAVPLIRELAPHDAGPVELEFDVPAQPDDADPPVFIGALVTGPDATAVADASDRLVRADVRAVVRLERVQSSGLASVELKRSQRVGRDQEIQVALSPDGSAPGLFAFDADVTTMQQAGVSSLKTASTELAFAYSPSLPAGRYRLSVHIDRNREALIDASAQLLIAYSAKAK